MKTETFYGFTVANHSEKPAWFHTPEAARRFAAACGWENAVVETSSDVESGDVLDTPEKPWTK